MSEPLLVVGDALLDRDVDGQVERVAPDAPVPVVADPLARARPGGAALAAALIARDGHPVVLATALGADAAGRELAALLDAAGVEVVDLGRSGRTPEKVRVSGGGHVLVRVDYDGDVDGVREPQRLADVRRRVDGPVLVSDY